MCLSELAKDPRLDQKVSVKVSGLPLSDFLANISKQTGIELKSQPDVADLRLIIMAKDIQLRNLLDSIAQALHLKISRRAPTDNGNMCSTKTQKLRKKQRS